jgi:hypothetical protein
MARRKRKSNPFVEADFCSWMDGYCEAFEDFSAGAWQASCEDAVEQYNKAHGTRIGQNDGFHIWLQSRN